MISIVLLHFSHLAREAGKNDISPCFCQEHQNAEKIDAADTTQNDRTTVDLESPG